MPDSAGIEDHIYHQVFFKTGEGDCIRAREAVMANDRNLAIIRDSGLRGRIVEGTLISYRNNSHLYALRFKEGRTVNFKFENLLEMWVL